MTDFTSDYHVVKGHNGSKSWDVVSSWQLWLCMFVDIFGVIIRREVILQPQRHWHDAHMHLKHQVTQLPAAESGASETSERTKYRFEIMFKLLSLWRMITGMSAKSVPHFKNLLKPNVLLAFPFGFICLLILFSWLKLYFYLFWCIFIACCCYF